MKLGMAGPGYWRAKAALSVPLQNFLVQASAGARGDCRDALGRFLFFTALEKPWGLGKVTPGKLGDLGTLLPAGLGRHIHGEMFPAGSAAAPGADRENLLEGLQLPCTSRQLT